jgi:molybdopterin-containing oxidoreductase family membrane subunit
LEVQRSEPIVNPEATYLSVTEKIGGVPLSRRTPRFWWVGFFLSFLIVIVFVIAVSYLFAVGVGIWGIQIPVGWGFAITNFVWWIGIGHAGTLISAILLLFRQDWRNSINRFAEAMTLFAVANAAMFPILHLGRPVIFYYLMPYPNRLHLLPQFRSPLDWDVFAITTYITISALFWYIGLIPDLASMRDRATAKIPRLLYGIFALGWRGSARHWHRYTTGYWLLGALATPLVISVHSIVGMDFAISIVPGWHSTIFPPYFVAGAIFSGFAMVINIAVLLRKFYHMEDLITIRHLENMAKVMLAMGLLVAYGYMMENFMALYSGDPYEIAVVVDRFTGAYWPLYWGLLLCNVVVPQFLWVKSIRRSPALLFIIAILINIGMWLERFIIIVQSLSHDYIPSIWQRFSPTVWDVATFVGTLGVFFALLFVFFRLLPMISIFEVRELVSEREQPAD